MHPELREASLFGWLTSSFRDSISNELSKQNDIVGSFPWFRGWGRQLEYESLNPSAWLTRMPFALPIERRFPYHDRRLVEFCLALPPELKYEHRRETQKISIRGRALQRHSLKEILPEEIQHSQGKVNFGEVYRRRIQQLKNAYMGMFAPPTVPLAASLGYLEREKFWTVLSESIGRIEKAQELPPLVYLWINRMTQLEIWLQTIRVINGNLRKLGGQNGQVRVMDVSYGNGIHEQP
jgi:hypothetical protein